MGLGPFVTKKFTILNTATVSDVMDVQGLELVALQIPAMLGTAITFNGNVDGSTTYISVRDSANTAVSWAHTASTAALLVDAVVAGKPPLRGLKRLQLGSVDPGATVAITALFRVV